MKRQMIAAVALGALAALSGAGNPFLGPDVLEIRNRMRERFGEDPVQEPSYRQPHKSRSGGKRQVGGKFKGSKAAKRASRRGGNQGKR